MTGLRRGAAWLLVGAAFLTVPLGVRATEIVIYGFEGGLEGWEIPDWARTSADYVGTEIAVSTDQAQEGASSLRLDVNFPGGRWAGAYAERMVEVTDWSRFGTLTLSVYVPSDAPNGLQARMILTVGSDWTWTEMNRATALVPGEWTAMSAALKPGSMDWKFFPDEQFRSSIRKIGVRVESDKQPVYAGPVFVDNIRLEE